MNTLTLPDQVRVQLESWAETGYPRETCGVLVGRRVANRVLIERAVFARNANTQRTHDRYQLDAHDLLEADQAAEADELEIVGIWHTHPDHPARPSETDRLQAWDGWSYLILSVRNGRTADLRSWRLKGEEFEEESIESWQP
jgi:proteasome lid subunit RPN8/RPN11